MNPSSNLTFEPATEADIIPLAAIMVRAFDDDTRRHLGAPTDHPPGYESGDWLRDWLTKGIIYKIIQNQVIIGGFLIILNLPKPHWNYLGSIFVDLPYQNQAIGSQTLQFIEQTFPARRWQTMTQAWATRNHYFYEKNGYTKVKEVHDPNTDQLVYVYEKPLS
jgi:GNAT superfamily N-acetyltransferase